MSRKSTPIELSESEIQRLEQWIRAGSTPQQVVLRARIVLAAGRGQQDKEIATTLHIQWRTVARWRRRAREQGIGCVWNIAAGRGRKASYGPDKVAKIIDATLHTKPSGSTHWSTRTMAEAQQVSKNTVHRFWQDLNSNLI